MDRMIVPVFTRALNLKRRGSDSDSACGLLMEENACFPEVFGAGWCFSLDPIGRRVRITAEIDGG